MKKYIPLLLFVIAFFFSAIYSFGSESDKGVCLSFIDQKDGLSNSAVLSFYKDDKGLMWIGTYDGLNCYDGNKMEVFRTDFSDEITFNNNVIADIVYAGNNQIWVCSFHGVSLMSLWSHKVLSNYSMTEDFKLYSNSKGNTWVIDDSCVYYFNRCENRFIKACSNPNINPQCATAYVSENGTFTLIGNGQTSSFSCMVSSFDKDSVSTRTSVFSQEIHMKPITHSFRQKDICYFLDEDCNLYLYDWVRKSKILITNAASLVAKYGKISGVASFYDDLIVYFHSQSIVRLKASDGYRDELLKRNVRIFCTYVDTQYGMLWMGTDGQGVICLTREDGPVNNILLSSISPNLSGQVRGLLTDSCGTLWIGTKGDGLLSVPEYTAGLDAGRVSVYTPGQKRTIEEYSRENDFYPVFSLSNSRFFDGFWVGMSDSVLHYYSRKKDKIISLDTPLDDKAVEIHGIYEQGDSVLWAATIGGGLKKVKIHYEDGYPLVLKKKNCRFFFNQRELLSLSSLCAYNDSILWLGTRGSGLVCFNLKTEEYTVISLKRILEKYVDDILSLYLDKKTSTLYVGTTAGMVSIALNQMSDKYAYVGRENGLFNDMIHGIVADDNGILWLGTNKGLVKYNSVNQMYYTYYYSRGVEVAEFSDDGYYVCPYTGNMFLGGVNGLLYVDNKKVRKPDFYPDIILRDISFGYVRHYWTEFYDSLLNGIVLPKGNHTFSLEYVAPDYTSKDMDYSYLLEGYSKDWSKFSRGNEAFFSDIPSGNYVFKVRYKKDMLDSTCKEFSIPLIVKGKWHFSWWVYLMFLFLVTIVSIIAYRLYKRHSKKSMESKKLNLSEQADMKCITNIDDINKSSYDQIVERFGDEVKEVLTINNLEQADFLLKVVSLIDTHLEMEDLSISFLSEKCNLSTRHFYRKFKECILISPIDLVKKMRMEKAAFLLQTTDLSIQEVIEKVGISSRSYFYKEFAARFGVTPGVLRGNAVSKSDAKEDKECR